MHLGSVRFFFLKEFNTFIQPGHIKLIKSDSNDFYTVTKKSLQINAVFSEEKRTYRTGMTDWLRGCLHNTIFN